MAVEQAMEDAVKPRKIFDLGEDKPESDRRSDLGDAASTIRFECCQPVWHVFRQRCERTSHLIGRLTWGSPQAPVRDE